MKRLFPLILTLALLAGCQSPAVDTSAPSPSPSYQVTTHWEALEESPEPSPYLARHWYEEDPDDLIPSENYGPLVPYLGGESSNDQWENVTYLYGLATQDGVIVTAPVFISVYPPLCWEYSSFDATELSMLALQRPQTNAQGNPIGRYGFAALDGSWYTGLEYCVIVATTPLGVLAVELEGGISLISPDGTQTHLWDPDQVPLPGYAYSEEYDTAWWDSEGQTWTVPGCAACPATTTRGSWSTPTSTSRQAK